MNVRNIIMIMVIGLTGCSTKTVDKQAAQKPKHEITIGDVRMAARLMPAPLQTDSATEAGNQFLWFNVSIDKANAAFEKEKLLYINFDMQQDFTLVASGDSLASVFCQRIENGRSESFEYAVAFEQPGGPFNDNYTLLYKDKLFGTGTVAFVYNQDDITKYRSKK